MGREANDEGGDRAAAGTVWDRVKGMRVAMMTTLDGHGHLHARPIGTLPHAGFADATLWFFTDLPSREATDIEHHRHVNLAYADPARQRYVSVSGVAEILRDRDRIRHLWRDVLSPWFPKGPDDPNLALIKVSVDSATCWDGPSGTIVRA